MRSPTRRQLMALAGGASVLALGAGAGLATVSSSDLARATLRRLAGPFVMADAEFDRFFGDFLAEARAPTGLKAGVLRMAEALPGGVRLVSAAPGAGAGFEVFERKLLTSFVTRTTYLQAGPSGAPITYLGVRDACSSPFAVLDMDAALADPVGAAAKEAKG